MCLNFNIIKKIYQIYSKIDTCTHFVKIKSMVDYNIELAHIYSDEQVGEEQGRSIEEGAKFIKGLIADSKTFSVSLLIDNYSTSSFTVNEQDLISLANSHGVPFDFVVLEAMLADLCDLLIRDMDPLAVERVKFPKHNKESLVLKHNGKIIGIRDYFETHERNTCAALIACWHLARLGVYQMPEGKIRRFSNRSFEARKSVTVLPKKYKSNEDKALAILGGTIHKDLIRNIEYVYF